MSKLKTIEKLEIKEEDLYSRNYDKKTLKEIADSALYVNETAKKLSRKNKKPVFVICNARSGTLLHYGIENWSDQLSEEEKGEFAKEWKNNPIWLESKILALFETAQKWMDEERLEWFTYSTQNVKVSSYSRQNPNRPVEKLPHHFPKMLKRRFYFVIADTSTEEFPGSFGEGCGMEKKYSGFKEIFKKQNYTIRMISRRTHKEETLEGFLPKCLTKFKKKTVRPAALLINPVKKEDEYYGRIDNHTGVIGWLGKKFAHDKGERERIRPVIIETNCGEMDLSDYVRIKIREYCKEG